MADTTLEELRAWYDRSNVEWTSLQAAELRFFQARSVGGGEGVLEAADALDLASRDASAFAIADPSPDPIWHDSFLGVVELWSEVVVVVHKISLDPDAYEDGGELRLNALHARIRAQHEALDDRRKEIFGD